MTDSIPHAVDARLEALEIKASFTEDLLERLHDLVIQQQQQIERLTRELLDIRRQQQATDAGGFVSLRDERPPHY